MKIGVLGVGIAGLSLAYHLKIRGHEVHLYDRGALVAGNTSRAAGILTFLLDHDEDLEAVQRARRLYATAEEKSHGIFRFRKTGLVRLARSDASARALDAVYRRVRDASLPVQPGLPPGFPRPQGLQKALFSPEDGYVDPSAFALALYTFFRATQTPVHLYEAVEHLHLRADGVEVHTRYRRETYDLVVLALGVWTARFLQATLQKPLPLKPYRAQAARLVLPERQPGLYDMDSGVYWIPESTGQYIVGDGTQVGEFQPDAFPEQADEAFFQEVAGVLGDLFPAFADTARLGRGWAGLLAGTPDRFPLAGPYPGVENLWIFTGFNGYGIMRAPGYAELVAQSLHEGREPPPFLSLRRFPRLDLDFTPGPGFPPLASGV